MKITIYGAGYVGLVTAVCLAEVGHEICCVDIDADKIEKLQQGLPHLYEEGLAVILQKNLAAKRIVFTTDRKLGVDFGIVQMIAVGTPALDDGSSDLRFVDDVVKTISDYMTEYKLIVMKSTVKIGTAERIKTQILKNLASRHQNIPFDVASNPEFLQEGKAIQDFMNPTRIVIGVENSQAEQHLQQMYNPWIAQDFPFLVMSLRSAEMAKYASNAFLAAKISFINEMSQLTERLNADIEAIKAVMSYDPRIGSQFLNAGCGFGGSCFPKDIAAFTQMAREVDYTPHMLTATLITNQIQQESLFHKINRHFKGSLQDLRVALWGLSFKPNTDDIRCASSLVLINQLLDAGANVQAYDPMAMHHVKKMYQNKPALQLSESAELALSGADILVVVTEWHDFKNRNLSEIKKELRYPVIFDGRNIFDPEAAAKAGITYYGVGRSR